MAGHGLEVLDGCLDVCLRQGIEVGHLGSSSNAARFRDELAQQALIPVFKAILYGKPTSGEKSTA